jgi:hypothetical protein
MIRHQNLGPDPEREAAHERARAVQESDSPRYARNLANLIAQETGDVSAARLAEIRARAADLANAGIAVGMDGKFTQQTAQTSEQQAPTRAEAAAKYRELMANPTAANHGERLRLAQILAGQGGGELRRLTHGDVTSARARIAELQAHPLPPGARDYQKVERAAEMAKLYAITTNQVGFTDHNGAFVRTAIGPEDAA